MRFCVIFFAASAGLVTPRASAFKPASQRSVKTTPNRPTSSSAKLSQSTPVLPLTAARVCSGLQQLLCLCRSTPLVDAFTSCAGQTCPDFAAQVNGTAICQSSGFETGALDPSDSGDAGPSDTTSGVDTGPASGAGASNTVDGTQAPVPTKDAGKGAGARGVTMVDFVVGGVALVRASGSLVRDRPAIYSVLP